MFTRSQVMPPKAVSTKAADISPVDKNLLKVLQTDIAQIREDIRKFSDIKNELRELKEVLQSKDNQISRLESKVESIQAELSDSHKKQDATDQYSRKDSLILSGPALPPFQAEENTMEVVQKLIMDHLSVEVHPNDISITHRLGPIKASTPNKRNIYVKFARRNMKKEIIVKSRGRNRSANLFANESITPLRRKMYNALRAMKKNAPDVIKGCTSMEGKIFAFTPPATTNGRDRKHFIEDWAALQTFCREYVKAPLDGFLQPEGART